MLTAVVDYSVGWHLETSSFSLTCPPDLGDVDTYFFSEKIFRSEIRMCVTVTSFLDIRHHYNTHSDLRSKYFFEKKYVSTSPSPCAHFGERNLFLSAIRRSNRRSQSACVKSTKNWRNLEKITSLYHIFWSQIEIFFQNKSMCRHLLDQAQILVKEICF